MNLKAIGINTSNLVDLAQDRDFWNLWVPEAMELDTILEPL